MNPEITTAIAQRDAHHLAPSIGLVLDDADPRLPDVDTGEVVALDAATVPQIASFLDALGQMAGAIRDARARVVAELADRADGAGTRTLRAGNVKVTLNAPETTIFALDAALADLDAYIHDVNPPDDLVLAIERIERVKTTREVDMAGVKRLRAMGDRDVNAILDAHSHVQVAARSAKVEWSA